jgi:pilus assembly protein Flp/PilA
MTQLLRRLLRDETGATAIEYGLIAALVSITIISAAALIGGSVQGRFEQVQTSIN